MRNTPNELKLTSVKTSSQTKTLFWEDSPPKDAPKGMGVKKRTRVGIYSGTFDPVHLGHITFALQSINEAGLDIVYLMPERQSRRKPFTSHFGHRVAMLNRAVMPHSKLKVLEVDSRIFSVTRTIPEIKRRIGTETDLVLLMGSDVADHLPNWQNVQQLQSLVEFCVGLRQDDDKTALFGRLELAGFEMGRFAWVESFASHISSTSVRRDISLKRKTYGVLTSVYRYAQKEWLYI